MRLGLYFARRFLSSFLRVSVILVALLFLIEFLDFIRQFSELDDALGLSAQVALMGVPSFFLEVLPIAIMLSGLAFSVAMSRTSEFVVARATGMSALNILYPTFLAVGVIAIIEIFALSQISAKISENRDQLIGQYSQATTRNVSKIGEVFWLRQQTDTGQMIVKAQTATTNGEVLRNVTAIDFNLEGKAERRIFSPITFLRNDQLVFTEGKVWDIRERNDNPELAAKEFQFIRLPTQITPNLVLQGFPSPNSINMWALPSFSENLEKSGFSALLYRLEFQQKLARPLLLMAMLGLGVALTLQTARLGNQGINTLGALILGFGAHFLASFSGTLGAAGQIPILVAGWFPAISILLIVLAIFLFLEDG